MKSKIRKLEDIISRTPKQEKKLKKLKEELAKLEQEKEQSQNPNQKKWWPWIIGGVVIAVLVGIIIYLLIKNDKKKTL